MSRQENDTISRRAAISLPPKPKEDRYFQTYNLDDAFDYGWWSLQECIRKLPSAEPEIIRCKDCKWFGDFGCAIRIVDDTDKPTENDYCSFAERKSNE